MSVTADYQIDVRNLFRQQIVLRLFQRVFLIFHCTAVRQTYYDISILVSLYLFDDLCRRLSRILEEQSALRRIIHRGFAYYPEHCRFYPVMLDHHIILHTVAVERIFEQLRVVP